MLGGSFLLLLVVEQGKIVEVGGGFNLTDYAPHVPPLPLPESTTSSEWTSNQLFVAPYYTVVLAACCLVGIGRFVDFVSFFEDGRRAVLMSVIVYSIKISKFPNTGYYYCISLSRILLSPDEPLLGHSIFEQPLHSIPVFGKHFLDLFGGSGLAV